jgi:hypothetical protein
MGLFVFRLRAYPVTKGQCACLEDDGMPNAYTFNFLGNDAPLYAQTQPETDPHQETQLHQETQQRPSEIRQLLALMNTSGLTQDELSRFNRLLLEQAFPNELGQYFRIWRVGEDETLKSLDAALQKWRRAKSRNAIIEITDNGSISNR